jgi:hypothetical protein
MQPPTFMFMSVTDPLLAVELFAEAISGAYVNERPLDSFPVQLDFALEDFTASTSTVAEMVKLLQQVWQNSKPAFQQKVQFSGACNCEVTYTSHSKARIVLKLDAKKSHIVVIAKRRLVRARYMALRQWIVRNRLSAEISMLGPTDAKFEKHLRLPPIVSRILAAHFKGEPPGPPPFFSYCFLLLVPAVSLCKIFSASSTRIRTLFKFNFANSISPLVNLGPLRDYLNIRKIIAEARP